MRYYSAVLLVSLVAILLVATMPPVAATYVVDPTEWVNPASDPPGDGPCDTPLEQECENEEQYFDDPGDPETYYGMSRTTINQGWLYVGCWLETDEASRSISAWASVDGERDIKWEPEPNNQGCPDDEPDDTLGMVWTQQYADSPRRDEVHVCADGGGYDCGEPVCDCHPTPPQNNCTGGCDDWTLGAKSTWSTSVTVVIGQASDTVNWSGQWCHGYDDKLYWYELGMISPIQGHLGGLLGGSKVKVSLKATATVDNLTALNPPPDETKSATDLKTGEPKGDLSWESECWGDDHLDF